ncbi:MAG: NTP transferase domain-containing protein [Candidatus Pacebacteria bacterium]|nr:NTP transferase domain-containing protein [Candidatus Paceibacterota bacterium]
MIKYEKMTKQRLTITLSASTLNKVDALIDNKNIRSRSHAIETLIQQSLTPNISTAVILAGSKKKIKKPKPLTKINGKELIFYTLELLEEHGVEEVVILTNQAGKKIEEVVNQSQFPSKIKIKYLYENKPLGTAGAIKEAQSKINNKTFYCLHGDILTNIDLTELAAFHQDQKALATIALKPRVPQDSYDNVFLQGNKVVDFEPKKAGQIVSIVNTGVYIFEPAIFDWIPDTKPAKLETDVFPRLANNGRLLGFTFQGVWFDVATDKNYKEALKEIH